MHETQRKLIWKSTKFEMIEKGQLSTWWGRNATASNKGLQRDVWETEEIEGRVWY